MDPFVVIPYKEEEDAEFMSKEQIYAKRLNEERKAIYSEYKGRFEDMSKKVMKAHNIEHFKKVSELLDGVKSDPDTIPTCLLINSKP